MKPLVRAWRAGLGLAGRWALGPRPLEALPAWLAPAAPGPPREAAAAVSARVASRRRPGRGGPWLPPQLAGLLRTPGCRQYAAYLAHRLRRAGHPAALVLGVDARGAHAWVEVGETAYDFENPGGVPAAATRARFGLAKVVAPAGAEPGARGDAPRRDRLVPSRSEGNGG